MKIFLDDIRNPPDDSWTICKTYPEFINLILNNWDNIEEISFDHDLGTKRNGYDCVEVIECYLRLGIIKPNYLVTFSIHTQNPVGRNNIKNCIDSIQSFMTEV